MSWFVALGIGGRMLSTWHTYRLGDAWGYLPDPSTESKMLQQLLRAQKVVSETELEIKTTRAVRRSAKLKAVLAFVCWILHYDLLQVHRVSVLFGSFASPISSFLNAASVCQVATTAEIQKLVPQCA